MNWDNLLFLIWMNSCAHYIIFEFTWLYKCKIIYYFEIGWIHVFHYIIFGLNGFEKSDAQIRNYQNEFISINFNSFSFAGSVQKYLIYTIKHSRDVLSRLAAPIRSILEFCTRLI